jgi:hypothetical protein
VRFTESQRESENWERLKMSFEHWSERDNFDSLVQTLKLCSCNHGSSEKKSLEGAFSEGAKRMRRLRSAKIMT